MTTTAPRETEAQFERKVLQYAALCGWSLRYHTRYSLRSTAGFPDLVLVRPPRLVFAELKRDGRAATEAQAEWLLALQNCAGTEAFLWSPNDWPQIERVLR